MRRRTFMISLPALAVAGVGAPLVARANPDLSCGQAIITGFRGTRPSDPEVDLVRRLLEAGRIAGVILLKRNIRSPEQLTQLAACLKGSCVDVPPIIAIDQEGGAVSRLGRATGFADWKAAAELVAEEPTDSAILAYYGTRAGELAAAGINLNLGPVVDLNINPFNPIIGTLGRSYSRQEEVVIRFASLFVQAHRSARVKTCLKHFPGHGSAHSDSHLDLPDVSVTWTPAELTPFQRLVEHGLADAIMTAHLTHPTFSELPWMPASLSARTVQKIRDDLKFDGPIFTDDMQMGAISSLLDGPSSAAVAAVQAGNSFLIYSNYRRSDSIQTAEIATAAIREALTDGRLDAAKVAGQLDQARQFRATL
ncbi:glycoside hydrolase family 3 protein [Cereibacter sphaeroides]|nr:glycoside hydrolase family 3 protein [Cereibacter sphaeroides]AZB61140.1 glycoside hydrolase family 3 protein [Cereibacter sphaeroides]